MTPLLAPFIRRQRTALVEPLIAGDVLEIGCNDAATLRRANPKLRRYVGIDVDADALARARATYPEREFEQRDIEKDELGFQGEFDTVLLVALIEHILNQRHLLEQCERALRPGGVLVVTTPTPFGNDIVHRTGARLGLFHASVIRHHVVIYDKTRLAAAAAMVGFALVSHKHFQLRCNQLAVFRKASGSAQL
jgi:SAM-dependent methyltransferase